MNGEPCSGSYYHPGDRKQIYLHVMQKPRGLEGMRPWYVTNYGPYVGASLGWSPPRDWNEWVPYTGQPDCLMEAKVRSMVATAQIGHYSRPWWKFW